MLKKKLREFTEEEIEIYRDDLYTMTEQPLGNGYSAFTAYKIFDGFEREMERWEGKTLTEEERQLVTSTDAFDVFMDVISYDELDGESGYDYDDYSSSKFLSYSSKYEPQPAMTPEEEKKMVDDLCKSDTIVFHLEDSTTVMLKPIYEGKGWDVYTKSSWEGLSQESVHELIKRHDRIVCLGHGTPHGLIGGNIGKDEVPLLKDKNKKIFSMWCYAATFWKNNGFSGYGIMTSDNYPSEDYEAKYACNATVSKEWIFDNMMLAGKIVGEAIDIFWTNPQAALDYYKKEYSTKSKITTEDERKVVEFNTNSMQIV